MSEKSNNNPNVETRGQGGRVAAPNLLNESGTRVTTTSSAPVAPPKAK